MLKKILIITALMTAWIYAAEINCGTYCSITKGFDVKEFSGILFFGTDGGLVVNTGGSNVIYDPDDGLYKTDITHIDKDFRGMFWLGHKDCAVSVFDLNKKKTVYLNDIEQSGSYSLNNIYSSAKYIYIAASGLLARYKYNGTFNKYEIAEINTMMGNVKDVSVSGGYIYAASGTDLYSILETAQNINYLNNWSKVTGFSTGTTVTGFASDGDKLYALTNNGLYLISGLSAVKQLVFNNEYLYCGMFDSENFYVSEDQVGATVIKAVAKNLAGAPEIIFGTEEPDSKKFRVFNDIVYFTSSSGYSYYDASNDTEYSMNFNVPKEKGIKKAVIESKSGNLVYLTNNNFSYMHMKDASFHEKMFSARGGTKNIHAKNDDLYICTWGSGVNLFKREGAEYVFNKKYSFGGSKYVWEHNKIRYPVHPGVAEDNQGNIWITNWDDLDRDSTIVRISPLGQISSFVASDFFFGYDIFVDYFNNQQWVWLGSSTEQFGKIDGIGVGVLDGQELDIKTIAVTDGIIDIVRDKDNIIWIATNNGIKNIDLNIGSPSPANLSLSSVNSLLSGPISNFIYDTEVNGINEKWFATDKGVSVLSSDNKSWRHYVPKYYSESAPVSGEIIKTNLFDDVINDIEFDEKNGIAVLSSNNGLTFLEYGKVFKSDKVKSGEIQTKPSPFINDGSAIMGFFFPEDGNTYDTAKIFDLKGFLIRGGDGSKELNIQNGWDGKDNDGKMVSTGIYQVIAYNKNERTKNITGKIAVVRK